MTVAFLAALFLSVSCSAAPVTTCERPWEAFAVEVTANAARQGVALEYFDLEDKEMMEVFVAAFNATDPPTDFAPDTVYFMGANNLPNSVVVLVREGCVLIASQVPNGIIVMMLLGLVPGKQRSA